MSPIATLWLAGASGLVGREVLRHALAQPGVQAVRALVRRPLAWPDDPRVQQVMADFTALPACGPAGPQDAAVCALGTTIRAAGSQAAFRTVDHDAVLAFAQAMQRAGVRRLGVVSALGADAASSVFYNRVKGEAEAGLKALGFQVLVIARPSLLLGDREALGQPTRRAERLGQWVVGPVGALIPARWRPIDAAVVARALCRALESAEPGVTVLESDDLQRTGRA